MKIQLPLIFVSLIGTINPSFASKKVEFSDDLPFEFHLTSPSLKVLQFTDLHLTYGFDKNDQKTLKLIKNITNYVEPDLVIFTGDQTLSITAVARYKQLVSLAESLKTPWTFIFGNHDNDFNSYYSLLEAVNSMNPQYLYFKVGPSLIDGGYGNFEIAYYYNDLPFYHLYMLDTKNELDKRTSVHLSRYDYLSEAQVNWYKDRSQDDNVKSTIYMHIPLPQHREVNDFPLLSGQKGEGVYSQGLDTGFFDAMKDNGVSEAVFVGHDHRNNYVFEKEGIKLGYGQISGYNAYGTLTRGARVVEISEDHEFSTYIIYEDLHREN